MAKGEHVIELNGQRYDALTGKIVSAKPQTGQGTSPAKHVDGFVRRKAQVTAAHTPARQTPAAVVHKTTERSKTLMRTTVKKPVTHKIHAKAAVTQQPATVAASVSRSSSERIVPSIKPSRILRANSVKQSNLIRKFGDKQTMTVRNEHVPVKPAPDDTKHVQSLRTTSSAASTTQAVANPFDVAIELANSHFQPQIRKVRFHERMARKLHIRPGMATVGLVGLVIVAGGGFWMYQNVPRVAMRVATTRSGVSATLPSYQPAGFSMKGPIAAVPGQVSINFQSNSDNRAFQVVQRSTDWNSEALLNDFVANKQKQYQSMQVKGRTIYLYDSNATWVDGGVWYQVKGDASLSRDQILRIVDGL